MLVTVTCHPHKIKTFFRPLSFSLIQTHLPPFIALAASRVWAYGSMSLAAAKKGEALKGRKHGRSTAWEI